MGKHVVVRYHDISAGHRVVGHENKCRHLHGHNYRIHFHCEAERLDSLGRVVDFGVIKQKLCQWLEDNFDHKFLAYEHDDVINTLCDAAETSTTDDMKLFTESVVKVPFNPTAENIAQYLVEVIAPNQLAGTGITVTKCVVEETAKCSATYEV